LALKRQREREAQTNQTHILDEPGAGPLTWADAEYDKR
jgi:hypothetical protein